MKNNLFIFYIIITFLVVFDSCSTDVDINAEYKEIPIVYCVLDPSQEYQYVKVNKAFLGEKSVSEMAQISDSMYFKENIVVVLKKYKNNDVVTLWTFDYCDTIKKQEGFFANDKNILYVKKIDFGENSKDNRYELIVNVGNGKHIIKGNVKLTTGANISKPSETLSSISITSYTNSFSYEFMAGNAATITEVYLKFNYLEVINSDTSYKSILFPLTNEVIQMNYNNDILKRSFSVSSFYDKLVNTIPVVENAKRYVKMPDSYNFIIYSADENYYTYTQVSKPPTGIVQFRPTYTNIEGGLGLLASRNSFWQSNKMSRQNIDTLYRGIYTKKLGFVGPYDNYYDPFFPVQ